MSTLHRPPRPRHRADVAEDHTGWLASLRETADDADPVPAGLVARSAALALGVGLLAHADALGGRATVYAEAEPCSRCEGTDHDGVLDPWGECPTCVEARAYDAATGYDPERD